MATKYTDEQKTTVMTMLADGVTVTDVARTTGIPRTTISTWRSSTTVTKRDDPKMEQAGADFENLRRELDELKEYLPLLRRLRKQDQAEKEAITTGGFHPPGR